MGWRLGRTRDGGIFDSEAWLAGDCANLKENAARPVRSPSRRSGLRACAHPRHAEDGDGKAGRLDAGGSLLGQPDWFFIDSSAAR